MPRRTLGFVLGMGGLFLGAGMVCYLAFIGAPPPPLASDPHAAKKVVPEVAWVASLAGLSVDSLPPSGAGTTSWADQPLISQMASGGPEGLHRLVEHGWIRVAQAMGGLTSLEGQKATELGLAVGHAGLYWQGRRVDESPGHYWERTLPFGWSALRRWHFLDGWPTEDRTGQDLLPVLMATLLGPDQATPERFYRRLARLLGKYQPLGLPVAMGCAVAAETWRDLLLIICTPAASEPPRQRLARAASLIEAGLSWPIVRSTVGVSPQAYPVEWASLAWRAGDLVTVLAVLPDPMVTPWRQVLADFLLAMPSEEARRSPVHSPSVAALRKWGEAQLAALLKEVRHPSGEPVPDGLTHHLRVGLTLGHSFFHPLIPVVVQSSDDLGTGSSLVWEIATLSWTIPLPVVEIPAISPRRGTQSLVEGERGDS